VELTMSGATAYSAGEHETAGESPHPAWAPDGPKA